MKCFIFFLLPSQKWDRIKNNVEKCQKKGGIKTKNNSRYSAAYLKNKKKEIENPEFLGRCTMPGCKNCVYTDAEYYTDGEENIFCSTDCILEWYGIEKH